jgi:tetratricopeptide (TPR) repeat protein
MMLGNRGETKRTFQETLEFLDRAKPHQYVFSCLSIYPGTRDFDAAVEAGWLDPKVFFREDFQELKIPFDADRETTEAMNAWFYDHRGIQNFYREDSQTALQIVRTVGEYHGAHLDVGGAYYREGNYALAKQHVERALELGTPVPGLALNYLACIAFEEGDLEAMKDYFMRAAKTDPQHLALIENVEKVRAWFKNQGPERNLPLDLVGRHEFQLLERTLQPTLPGPLPDDFADFSSAPKPVPRDLPARQDVSPEGHGKQGFPEKRLRVL